MLSRAASVLSRLFMRAEHLTDSEISGFIDRDLSVAERSIVEEHLEGCRQCRAAIAEVSQLTRDYEQAVTVPVAEPVHALPARSRPKLPFIAAALAASLTIIALTTTNGWGPSSPTERAATQARPDARPVISVVGPPEDLPADRKALVFSWHASGADTYRLTIFDETGSPVFARETTDTVVSVTDLELLKVEETYLWRVDAIADGIAASSEVRRVTVSR